MKEWNEVKKQLSAIVNVLLSMGATATAAWWALGNVSIASVSLALRLKASVAGTDCLSHSLRPLSPSSRSFIFCLSLFVCLLLENRHVPFSCFPHWDSRGSFILKTLE